MGCKSSSWTAILLDVQALGNVSGDYSSGFSDCSKAHRVLATNWGKVIEPSDANPYKEGTTLARSCESEGRGFKSWCWQRILSDEISVSVLLRSSCDGICIHLK